MKKLGGFLVAGALGVGLVSAVQAHVSVGVGFGVPAYPVYVAPPQPVYVALPPVVYAPPPAVVVGGYGYGGYGYYGRPYWRHHHGYYRHGPSYWRY
ncbi:MAG: Putative transmembrane protein [uncultured Caballeronia sp.]|nr:MAG: Putative transmembrane protein [uncultured Caballeronia sp.]